MIEYYPFLFSINDKEYYCIWYSDVKDGFLVSSNKVIMFKNLHQLNVYAKDNNLTFQKDITKMLIDIAIDWLREDSTYIDCKYFLDFWNIIGDLAYSVDEGFFGNSCSEMINNVYNKLFYGNNLPSIKGDGEDYYPSWNLEEIDTLIKIVKDGLRIIDTHLVG